MGTLKYKFFFSFFSNTFMESVSTPPSHRTNDSIASREEVTHGGHAYKESMEVL
jgi:hypothetical protein